MAKVIFTAWKSQSQLLNVRDEFYPAPGYNGPDMRSHACATVCPVHSLAHRIFCCLLK